MILMFVNDKAFGAFSAMFLITHRVRSFRTFVRLFEFFGLTIFGVMMMQPSGATRAQVLGGRFVFHVICHFRCSFYCGCSCCWLRCFDGYRYCIMLKKIFAYIYSR